MKCISVLAMTALAVTAGCTAVDREIPQANDATKSSTEGSVYPLLFDDLESLGITRDNTAVVIVVNREPPPNVFVNQDTFKELQPEDVAGNPIINPRDGTNGYVFQYIEGSTCVVYRSLDGTLKVIC